MRPPAVDAFEAATAFADPYDVPELPVRFNRLLARVRRRVVEFSPAAFAACSPARRPLLIDVREFSEWRAGRAEGAIHLPRGLLEARIEQVARDLKLPLVCYCADGSRSLLAAESLGRLGYCDVRSLAGGFAAWEKKGLPVVGRTAWD
jgi:rhodanese-related sulfurtransferase